MSRRVSQAPACEGSSALTFERRARARGASPMPRVPSACRYAQKTRARRERSSSKISMSGQRDRKIIDLHGPVPVSLSIVEEAGEPSLRFLLSAEQRQGKPLEEYQVRGLIVVVQGNCGELSPCGMRGPASPWTPPCPPRLPGRTRDSTRRHWGPRRGAALPRDSVETEGLVVPGPRPPLRLPPADASCTDPGARPCTARLPSPLRLPKDGTSFLPRSRAPRDSLPAVSEAKPTPPTGHPGRRPAPCDG